MLQIGLYDGFQCLIRARHGVRNVCLAKFQLEKERPRLCNSSRGLGTNAKCIDLGFQYCRGLDEHNCATTADHLANSVVNTSVDT